jgi:molybdate transport system regulatory protein
MPAVAAMSASVSLQKGEAGAVGQDRIALLEAIGAHGSISGGAKAVGLSYRAAWEAVQALNSLSDTPLLKTQVGGQRGGFAEVTSEGKAVIAAYRAVESELTHVLAGLERRLSGGVGPTLLFTLGLKTSARNALRGVVEKVTGGGVNVEVVLDLGEGVRIAATITRRSVETLGLAPGKPAMALIKSSFVTLAKGGGAARAGTRNRLPATVERLELGTETDEVILGIGGDKSLTATIDHETAKALELARGVRVMALINASHVILAVD